MAINPRSIRTKMPNMTGRLLEIIARGYARTWGNPAPIQPRPSFTTLQVVDSDAMHQFHPQKLGCKARKLIANGRNRIHRETLACGEDLLGTDQTVAKGLPVSVTRPLSQLVLPQSIDNAVNASALKRIEKDRRLRRLSAGRAHACKRTSCIRHQLASKQN